MLETPRTGQSRFAESVIQEEIRCFYECSVQRELSSSSKNRCNSLPSGPSRYSGSLDIQKMGNCSGQSGFRFCGLWSPATISANGGFPQDVVFTGIRLRQERGFVARKRSSQRRRPPQASGSAITDRSLRRSPAVNRCHPEVFSLREQFSILAENDIPNDFVWVDRVQKMEVHDTPRRQGRDHVQSDYSSPLLILLFRPASRLP